jgi:hypothetical protein
MIKGNRDTTPQDFLDRIFDILTFDPLEFIRMDNKARVAKLRETAHVELDFEALAAEHETDYKERANLKKEANAIEARINAMATLEGLPKEKLDDAAILAQLNEAAEANRKAQATYKAKQDLGAAAARMGAEVENMDQRISGQLGRIEEMKKELAEAERFLKDWKHERAELAKKHKAAEERYQAAPAGDPIDVGALTAELQSAQRTNRAIDAWRAKEALKKELAAKDQEWKKVDDRMAAREEKKRTTLAKAKIPIEGLNFNESMTEVYFNGLPLENLGEGEQIRLSTRIAMAANPKLRVLLIRNGEALDDAGLKTLYEMAIENDFQIWMARVDTSGKVGIFLEDGVVTARNEVAEAVTQ